MPNLKKNIYGFLGLFLHFSELLGSKVPKLLESYNIYYLLLVCLDISPSTYFVFGAIFQKGARMGFGGVMACGFF